MRYSYARRVAAALVWCGALAAVALAADTLDWMSDSAAVLEVRLAHADRDRVDGGTLRLDRTKRLVTWVGAPGDIGCKPKLESTLEAVQSVTTEDGRPGFIGAV